MKKREVKEFNEMIENHRHRYGCGSIIRESMEPNPNGYNVTQIIGIKMGNALMFSKD